MSIATDTSLAAPAQPHLLARLDPRSAEAFDECRTDDDAWRAPWQRFFDNLPAADAAAELDRKRQAIAQQIRADGVTHNLHATGGGASAARPWSLEALPLLIEPKDWAAIEQGVMQRARLLSQMQADAYGAQRLLHDALLPPALLFRHSGYLRPLHGVRAPGGIALHIVAFDLARGPDGDWWIVSQRTQSPSGLGYVLHNRLIVSRLFPEAFRELRVQHIASSYRRLLDTLAAQAREVAGGGTPRTVLLTPGPFSETYIEHAYLSRYLGLPLVEGGDLTVRGERLYLKTVDGLAPVHGLLRRLDDDFCDPLELRPDSTLGVPGLLQVVRAGNVVIANPLGSGFLESPAVQGFLPAIAQRLLGEDLLLPSLPTWWCGEAAAWSAVKDELAGCVMRPAFLGTLPRAALLDATQTAAWRARVDDDPDAWTVQGHVRFSQAPLWPGGGAFVTRPAMLRVFAIADDTDRWHVLPGGMTRVATRAPFSVSMQQGGTSLDTWVLTDGAVNTFSMLPQRVSADDIAARQRPVPSRSGENLFWFGRYTERTEQAVRLARVTLDLLDGDDDTPSALLDTLSAWCADCNLVAAGTPSAARSPQVFERSLLAALAAHEAGVTSHGIGFDLAALARTAGALRDRLSSEQWGLVRTMGDEFKAHFAALDSAVPAVESARPALERLTLQLAALTGTQTDRMTRDHGWRLLTVGRLIERLVGMAGALQALLPAALLAPPPDRVVATEVLLELFDSTITFSARYQRQEDPLALADLLVLDDANPRAFAGTLRRLRTEIGKLPGPGPLQDELRQLLPASGAGLTLDDLRDADDGALCRRLVPLAERLSVAGARLSDAMTQRYFAHAEGGDVLHRV